MAKASHLLKFTRLEFMTLLQCSGRLAASGAGAAVGHCTSASSTAAQAGHGSRVFCSSTAALSLTYGLSVPWSQTARPSGCEAQGPRAARRRRSSREQAFTQAFITMQQDKALGRLLQHFQHPPDFFLTLELLEITGGTV